MSSDPDFAQQQAESARLKQRMLQERQEAESHKAAGFLSQFVAAATAAGLEPEPLLIRGYGGKGTARTPLRGWYLKADRTLAVDTDANYYILIDQLSLLDRLREKMPQPSPPPLILGAGGRDGESMDLTEKLTELLPGWRSFGLTGDNETRKDTDE